MFDIDGYMFITLFDLFAICRVKCFEIAWKNMIHYTERRLLLNLHYFALFIRSL